MANEPGFQCSAAGCTNPTVGTYCDDHVRFCSDCDTEHLAAELHDGVCIDCTYDGDDDGEGVGTCPCGVEACS